MKTVFLLMAQYDGRTIIPLDAVCRDFFSNMKMEQFVRKLGAGDIRLPVVRMDTSQKAAKGIHLQDLADYLDDRRKAAHRELEQMTR